MYEYFTHGTNMHGLKAILQSGGLDDTFTDHEMYYTIDIPNGIYCHYIWDGLPVYPDMKWAYEPIIFVMDTSIAKRNEMYICDSGYFGECVESPESRIRHSKGNLKRKPNLNPLKKKILEDLHKHVEKRTKKTKKDEVVYLMSHEVIFKGQIPLTFVKAILISKSNYKKLGNEIPILEEYLKQRSIQLIPYEPTENFHRYFEMI